MSSSKWMKFPCEISELCIDITLNCGQSFRWKKSSNGEWFGVAWERLWILSQNDSTLKYKAVPSVTKKEGEKFLRDYFQWDVNLEKLYNEWAAADENFANLAPRYKGIRILRQDPVENLFAFICSSNNNIQRITGMVDKLCLTYGTKLTEHAGETYYNFPTIEALAKPDVENKLRSLGFGYRAKFIHQSAVKIQENGGRDWLLGLRKMSYREAKTGLMTLPGIGAKVADCICLMSLDHSAAIPVDTHVFQIAKTYLPHLASTKSVTERVYNEIGAYFQQLFGPYAGWAHSVLFSADLRHLKNSSPQKRPTDGSGLPIPPKKKRKKKAT